MPIRSRRDGLRWRHGVNAGRAWCVHEKVAARPFRERRIRREFAMAEKTAATKGSQRFAAEERAAMKARARELKTAKNKAEWETEVLAKIAEMPESDRTMAERIHAIVSAAAPDLASKTWYGMPAYANQDGKVVCFFRSADKFKERYATFGFNEPAKIDEGSMWATTFALTKLTAADEKKIAALVKLAVS